MLTGNLDKIAEHGKRADGIVKSMLAHSRGGSGERQSVDSTRWSRRRSTSPITAPAPRTRISTSRWSATSTQASQPIELVPQDITRVFLNLFGNGFYAANKRRQRGRRRRRSGRS